MAALKRLLPVVVGGVLAVLVGSVAWTHAGTAAPSLTPGTAAATIDKLFAAQTAGDATKMTAMYTRSAIMWQDGNSYAGTAQIREHNEEAKLNAYRVKRISPVIVNGNVATVYERVGACCSTGVTRVTWLALGVYQLQDGLVNRSWEFILHGGLPSTPPFQKGEW